MSKFTPVIGAYGSLPFVCSRKKVLTFSDLSREQSVRWAKHDVIGKKPVLEFVGYELTTVSMKIRFDTSLGIPPAVGLHHLKKMLNNGEHKALVIGGEYLGRYVIESLSEERNWHTAAGVCQVAEATLTLKEWDGPRMLSWKRQLKRLSPTMKRVTGLSS
ncbi:MAG: phage tail protein [Sutterella sp.]